MSKRQQAIADLTAKEEALIDRFNDCEDEDECERLLEEIAALQLGLMCLDTEAIP